MSDASVDITLEAALLTALMDASDEKGLSQLAEQLGVQERELRAARSVVAVVIETLHGDDEAGELLRRAAASLLAPRVPQPDGSQPAGAQPEAGDDEGETVRPPAESIAPPTQLRPGPSLSASALEQHADELARATVELGTRSMPVADYAVLCAACGAFPARRKEWHARFGVSDDEARRQLDDAWEQRFTVEPALRDLWDLLLRRFRAWLVQYGAV